MKLSPEFNFIYGIGFFLEMLGICLLAFALYIMPHVFFGSLYSLPSFIFSLESWVTTTFNNGVESRLDYVLIIFLPFFLVGILCLSEARRLTARIENQLLEEDKLKLSFAKEVKIRYSESLTTIFRLLLFIAIILLIASFLVYLTP